MCGAARSLHCWWKETSRDARRKSHPPLDSRSAPRFFLLLDPRRKCILRGGVACLILGGEGCVGLIARCFRLSIGTTRRSGRPRENILSSPVLFSCCSILWCLNKAAAVSTVQVLKSYQDALSATIFNPSAVAPNLYFSCLSVKELGRSRGDNRPSQNEPFWRPENARDKLTRRLRVTWSQPKFK